MKGGGDGNHGNTVSHSLSKNFKIELVSLRSKSHCSSQAAPCVGVFFDANNVHNVVNFLHCNIASCIDVLLISGRPITAAEAASYGLVSKVFPVEDLVEEAVKTADHIAGLSQVFI